MPAPSFSSPDWWRQAAVYQIYPRSFADANGDGIGDLAGITSRVPYLTSLGIDAVWLCPFYPSHLADGGYDVDDYQNVDPRIGTLEDFDHMVRALHEAHIKLIIDIVPNHCSNYHEWFQEAIESGPGSPARERFHFRDAVGPNPPNTWGALFGGPTWTRVTEPDGTLGQWYFHTCSPEQPDWNWDHPDVQRYFLETLRFWSDRGVDGFRVDMAHGCAKNLDPAYDVLLDINDITSLCVDGQHPTHDRDEIHAVYRQWRQLFNEYDPPRMAVAEAWVPPHRAALYASKEELGQSFNFELLQANFDARQFREIIDKNVSEAARAGSSTTWVFSNHDVVRHTTRYGLPDHENDGHPWLLRGGSYAEVDLTSGTRRAIAATLLMLALPGSAYLYQGEELALPEVGDLPDSVRQDPAFFRDRENTIGRDGCRVPLPWSASGRSLGFGEGDGWLPQPDWFAVYSVETQEGAGDSYLNFYRTALALRRELQDAEELTWHDSPENTLHFSRPGGWHCFTNFGKENVPLPAGQIIIGTQGGIDGVLPGEATVWLRL
ncbi:glycoside hydrolase family 13 protein [Ancrocorticia populi]|uniref:glycoside hydrolase family 13 protein n=2 Tax=Ancrocorticia populi TaxID=2175228 RepID=UPI0023570104|nr:glycoside hydrolase family 13 protein [Ancrocorticia populi]